MEETLGRISSFESLGLVDGPGIRYVVFLQGCQSRCKYCHNPETWALKNSGITITPSLLLERICRFKPYFGKKGGVTFSGGEPLLQAQFLLECLKLCKDKKIHCALDTSGVGFGYSQQISQVLQLVDLIILDIKETREDKFKDLVGQSMSRLKDFLKEVQALKKPLWIRQVVIPGVNDNEKEILRLGKFLKKIKYIEKVELLPYKNMCESKYKTLGIPFRMEGVPNMDEKRCRELEQFLRDYLSKE